jgi:L-glyceraldehyde 3-phosphate reductase
MSTYHADDARCDALDHRPSGRGGLRLPALALGLWQNFGDENRTDIQRAILRRAFDRGITHFDR